MKKKILCFLSILIFFFATEQNLVKASDFDISVCIQIEGENYFFDAKDIKYAKNFDDEFRKSVSFDAKMRILKLNRNVERTYYLQNLEEKVQKIAQKYQILPRNSEAIFDTNNPKKTIIFDEFVGKKIESELICKEISQALAQGKSFCKNYEVVDDVPPITRKSITSALQRCVRFSTDISHSSADRKHNVALALSCFNGLMIKPNEEISFNQIVGERTIERGYKEAKIILKGKYVLGVGGGVCQASTTIYNALLRADFSATKVCSHSLNVSYIQPSFDAMVSSVQDMKMQNSNNVAFLKTYCKEDRAYVEVWRQTMPYKIFASSVTTFEGELPPTQTILDDGKYAGKLENCDAFVLQSAKPKMQSKGYLIYETNGKQKKVLIRTDSYDEQVGIVIQKSNIVAK